MKNYIISPPKQLTPNQYNHFFGYYGICPWSADGKYFICLETDFQDHLPKTGEKARILVLNLEENSHYSVAETQAWNFQQGAMLHWVPNSSNEIIFNDTDGQRVFSRIVNIKTRVERKIDYGINALAHNKRFALSISFQRLRKVRKVVSYPCEPTNKIQSHPADDGIYLVDLEKNSAKLLVTYDQIWKADPQTSQMNKLKWFNRALWFNHVCFSPFDEKFFFLARYRAWNRLLVSSMWVSSLTGNVFKLEPYGTSLSHFEWFDENNIILTKKTSSEIQQKTKAGGRSHVKINLQTREESLISPQHLTWDGHPTIHPNKTLMATDRYPYKSERRVFLCDLKEPGEPIEQIASFPTSNFSYGKLRCDPHPRWNHDGSELSYDGLTPQGRQVFVVKVTNNKTT